MSDRPGAARLRLVFETHATSVDNEAGLASGWADAPLSPSGEQQARMLGVRRADEVLAAVFCSDLARSWHTAEIAFDPGRVAIVRDRRLRECHYGTLTRHPAADIEARRSAQIVTPFPAGESYEQVTRRVGQWLDEVRPRFAGQTIVVVGHRGTFYAFQHLLAHVPLAEAVAAPWWWQPGWVYGV